MHIGMGLVCGGKIKDMVESGFNFIVFLADWHAWINDKLGGDMGRISLCCDYFKECFTALGMPPEKVRYVRASELAEDIEYWEKVVRIAKSASLRRIMRSLPIMGRSMDLSDVETAWVYYPCMQAADIFHMGVDVACAGIDQRRAHMLARDVAERLGWIKPVCVHTPLLTGLRGPMKVEGVFDEDVRLSSLIGSKMSKSSPEGCILVHDDPSEIRDKVIAAFCPPKEAVGNPVLELVKYVVFPWEEGFEVPRPIKYGGSISYECYEDVERDYVEGRIHPLDLKNGVAESLVRILKPVRDHFERKPDLLKMMMEMEITR